MPESDEPTPEEWLEIEAADAYLDALGNNRDFEGDQLGATEWRNEVDAEPLNIELPADGDVPPAITKGTPMSNIDNAGQLENLGTGDHIKAVAAALTHADAQLVELWQMAQTIVSEGQSSQEIGGAVNNFRNGIADLTGLLVTVTEACRNAAGRMRNV